jgi:hypothetical protein
MAHGQRMQISAQTEENETVFGVWMFWIADQESMLIRKHGLGLLERQTMLSNVLLVFPLIPLKLEFAHIYIICTLYLLVKTESHMSNTGVSCGPPQAQVSPATKA